MLNGFINLNKCGGMTSFQALAKLRHFLRASGEEFSKIGHMGTLDPDGEGVLPVALGRATRLFDYLSDKTKVYYTEFVFGQETDTLDASGKVTRAGGRIPDKNMLLNIIPALIGRVDQLPPAYSAKVIGGERAYKLARRGEEITLKPKTVDIGQIELLEELSHGVFSLRITCGGGTYIRSIARDMAAAAGTYAYMRYIRRERSGMFTIDKASTLAQIAEEGILNKLIPLEEVCKAFPRYSAPLALADRILNGVKVYPEGMPDKDFALYIGEKLIGIAANDSGALVIKTRLL